MYIYIYSIRTDNILFVLIYNVCDSLRNILLVRQVTQIILHSRLKWQFTFHYVSNIAYIIMRQYSLTIYNRQQAKHDNENSIITLRGGGEFRMHIRLRNPKLLHISCTFTKLVGIIIRLRLIPLRKFYPHHAMILNTQRNVA